MLALPVAIKKKKKKVLMGIMNKMAALENILDEVFVKAFIPLNL